jgi:hypothetical protein
VVVQMADEKKRGRPKDPNSARSQGINPKKGISRITLELSERQSEIIRQLRSSVRPKMKKAALLRDALFEYAQKRGIDFPVDETPSGLRDDQDD